MTIPTRMSLQGFIATPPGLTFTGSGNARFHARAGIEQWRKEGDGAFTKLDPVYCDLVLFGKQAESDYAKFRTGDEFVAAGYVHEYELQRNGQPVPREEFVAKHIGHDWKTKYAVERKQPDPPQPTVSVPQPAVGI